MTNAFNDYFISITNSTHSPDCTQFLPPKLRESAFLYPTDEAEIREVFSTLKNSNCCDIEDLQTKPVKNTAGIIATVLVHIANLSFSGGKFPKRLQLAKVSVIYKSGDIHDMSNYRPISVLPIFSKLIEKLIHKRMSAFIKKHTIITPFQFGFMKNRSTETEGDNTRIFRERNLYFGSIH